MHLRNVTLSAGVHCTSTNILVNTIQEEKTNGTKFCFLFQSQTMYFFYSFKKNKQQTKEQYDPAGFLQYFSSYR